MDVDEFVHIQREYPVRLLYKRVLLGVFQRSELDATLKEAMSLKNRLVFVDIMVDPKEHVYPMLVAPNGSMRDMWLRKGVRT